MSSKNRLQYTDGKIDNEFFESIKKKYNGRYYKKLQNTSGWSFPKEYQSNIEQEWEIYKLSKKKEFVDMNTTESINKNTQMELLVNTESTKLLNKNTELINNDKELVNITELSNKNIQTETREFVNRETQTELFYIYDIPNFYKNQFKQYIDLVQNL